MDASDESWMLHRYVFENADHCRTCGCVPRYYILDHEIVIKCSNVRCNSIIKTQHTQIWYAVWNWNIKQRHVKNSKSLSKMS